MSERPTPETDAFFRTFADGEAAPSHAEYYDRMTKLERERDAERAIAEQRGRLYDTAIRQLKALERDLDRLEAQLDAERALADRLVEALKFIATDKIANANDMRFRANKALTAWKEARGE